MVNRGVAAWKGRIFVATFDGRLVALDARTGQPVWSVMTVDSSKPYTITQAPRGSDYLPHQIIESALCRRFARSKGTASCRARRPQ